ncbi:MAG TPA: carbon-nitrogen family hydrolase [Actinocrinis sp.]|nr:carbon-nitrogen family hydrolase [Actinocrinis sp.]
MKVALIQFDVDLGRAPAESIDRAVARVHEAAEDGAELVLLPELWLHGGFDPSVWPGAAEPLHGKTAQILQQAAEDCGIVLHAGSLVERTPDGKLFNTSLVFDAEGELLAGYRKIHRFGFTEGEAAVMSPGEHPAVFDLADIDGSVRTRVGLATCYDVRFPELYRKLLEVGTQTVLMVAAWPAARLEHWQTLVRARAIENQFFVLAAAAAGTQAGIRMSGHSMVVDPWGQVIAEAGDEETILYAEIDLDLVEQTREKFPVLKDRRIR